MSLINDQSREHNFDGCEINHRKKDIKNANSGLRKHPEYAK